MDTNKFISEFQSISNKLNSYELERNNFFLKIKELEKENKKIYDKMEKEKNTFNKLLYRLKITHNEQFIQDISSILSKNNK